MENVASGRPLKIAIASDHAGFDLKEQVRGYLAREGLEVIDLGAFTCNPGDDYPDFAELVGEAVRAREVDRGILICGSGVGVSIAANKIPGVRAAMCHDSYSARQGVEHDDMNVLVLGARIIGSALAFVLVDDFLGARFLGEARLTRRLSKVLAIERKYLKANA